MGVAVAVLVEVAVGVLVGVEVGVLVGVGILVGVAVGDRIVVGSLSVLFVVLDSPPPETEAVGVTVPGAPAETSTVTVMGG